MIDAVARQVGPEPVPTRIPTTSAVLSVFNLHDLHDEVAPWFDTAALLGVGRTRGRLLMVIVAHSVRRTSLASWSPRRRLPMLSRLSISDSVALIDVDYFKHINDRPPTRRSGAAPLDGASIVVDRFRHHWQPRRHHQ